MPNLLFYSTLLGGGLTTACTALAFIQVVRKSPHVLGWIWLFNIAGTLDLVVVISAHFMAGAAPLFGVASWVSAFWVPLLLVSHYVLFVQLVHVAIVETRPLSFRRRI